MAVEDMEVEKAPADVAIEEEEEEDVSELQDALEEAQAMKDSPKLQVPLLLKITENTEKKSSAAVQIKERAVYDLIRAYCAINELSLVVTFLTDNDAFWSCISKAKTAKMVRQILDIVCSSTSSVAQQEQVARKILEWTRQQKRSFLRQRVEAKLACILFQQQKYAEALTLADALLVELKKLDDKQLLVETHLLESKLHFALHNVPKSKAALTASRTAANAIYVSPLQQAEIDSQSGTIHTEEADYGTAHSYFLEAFEQLDQMNETALATQALKYMMLCKILDSLRIALKSNKGVTAASASGSSASDSMLTGRQAVKYAGKDLEAMQAIYAAAQNRNLKELQAVLKQYEDQLGTDLLISHHLHILQEQLLESNLIRIIEPYSCVELTHIAAKIEMSVEVTERKLSQMILDGILLGILDQSNGQLVMYEENETDSAMAKGLQVIENMDNVVTSLFERSKALRAVMM
jgi:26S proteasome regulatory subunit N6